MTVRDIPELDLNQLFKSPQLKEFESRFRSVSLTPDGYGLTEQQVYILLPSVSFHVFLSFFSVFASFVKRSALLSGAGS
jgi:hypothetical protein